MARRGNPNWGRAPVSPMPEVPTEFEKVLLSLGLTIDDEAKILRSQVVKQWARVHRNSRYVPERLLEIWGFVVDGKWDLFG
jgi:hypothetical protein